MEMIPSRPITLKPEGRKLLQESVKKHEMILFAHKLITLILFQVKILKVYQGFAAITQAYIT